MSVRWLLPLAVLGLVALPLPARSAEDQATPPALIVRIRSLDGLVDDMKFLSGEAGAENQAGQALKAAGDGKGLPGVDGKRPLALYGSVGPNLIDSSVVVLVPISDEKAFLGVLEKFDLKPDKGPDDIYTMNVPNLPVSAYLRFANKYAYVALPDKDALSKDKLLSPAKLFAAKQTESMSAHFRLDQLPDAIKQVLLGQLELRLANLQDEKPEGETEAQHAAKVQTLKEVGRYAGMIINEGGEVALSLDVDHKAHGMGVELSVAGQPKSKLETTITDLGKTPSRVAGLVKGQGAMSGVAHLMVPEAMRESMEKAFLESVQKALAKEQDPAARKLGERLIRVLEPSVRAGEFDGAFEVRGPDAKKLYAIVAGAKVKNGAAIEKELKEIVAGLGETERAKIKLDAESAGNVKIHRIDVQKDKEYTDEARKTYGDNPLYFAFRPDAAFLALGEGGLTALKEALQVETQTSPPMRLELSFARMAGLPNKNAKVMEKAAKEAFSQGSGNDKLRIAVEGGKTLKVRLDMKTAVLKFFRLSSPQGDM